MRAFVHDAPMPRVVFGAGSLDRLRDETDRLGAGANRVLLLCTPGRQRDLARLERVLGDALAGVFHNARVHVPVETVESAAKMARELEADCYVSFGGGSATGLAKALALRDGRPIVAVPTTYAGSEVTPIWGMSDGARKTTGRDARVLPSTVVYDPELTVSLSRERTAASAMNAIAHCVEALYAPDATPVASLFAVEAIRKMGAALPILSGTGADPDARSGALYAAWLAGSALAAVSMGLHHKLCHVLGGTLDLSHAETHAALLPHVLAFNAPAASEAAAAVLQGLGASGDAGGELHDFARRCGAPLALRDLGMRGTDIERILELAADMKVSNPRPVAREDLRFLLRNAFVGARPGT